MIQAGTASQSQAMPLVRLSQNNVLRLVLPGSGVGGVAHPRGLDARRDRAFAAQNLSRPRGANRRRPCRCPRAPWTPRWTWPTRTSSWFPVCMPKSICGSMSTTTFLPCLSIRSTAPGADAHVCRAAGWQTAQYRRRHGPRNGAAYGDPLRTAGGRPGGRRPAVGLEGRPAGAGQNRGLRRKLTDPKQCLALPSERLI